MSNIFIDLLGQRFTRLLVVECAEKIPNKRATRWKCICDCGAIVVASQQCLRRGNTKSCGCLRRQMAMRPKTHGKSRTVEHNIWVGILSRCRNPNRKSFPRYGGRGIEVCDRWVSGENGISGFECFLIDVGNRPSGSLSIDRINVNGDYEPGNVRWADILTQANNKRNTRQVNYRGTIMPLTDAVRIGGSVIHYESAWTRIKWGWPVDIAVETPPNHRPFHRAA